VDIKGQDGHRIATPNLKQESPAIADKSARCFHKCRAVYLRIARYEEGMWPRWPAQSATIRDNRIAYWKRKELGSSRLDSRVANLPCTDGRTDWREPTLNARHLLDSRRKCVSQVRKHRAVERKRRLASSDINRPLPTLLITPQSNYRRLAQ